MQPNNQGSVHSLGLAATALVVPGLLSPAECAGLVARAEAAGFAAAGPHYPPGYRDNDRLVLDDEELAAQLWPRVAPFVPHIGGAAVALNPRFRLCRYRNGQSFCIHRDGPYVPSATRRSRLTCQVYLNDGAGMTGGRTRFYGSPRDTEPQVAVTPAAGAAILFDHGLWHDGEPVTAGTKWVLRTDVLFDSEPHQATGGHLGYVWAVCALPGGGLATAGRDGTVRGHAIEGATLHPLWTREVHEGSALALACDRSGRLWSAGRDHTLRVSSPGGPFAIVHQGDAAVLALTPHGEGVAASLADGTIVIAGGSSRVSLAGGSTRVFRPHAGWAWSVATLADGRLVSVGEGGEVVRLDPASGAVATLDLGVALRSVLAVGTHVVVGDAHGALHWLADAPEGLVKVRQVQVHEAAITAIAALNGGLATGSEDQRVIVQDAHGERRGAIAHKDFVRSVVALPGGRVASGSYDGEVRISGPEALRDR
jgi:predicted 2-oxoglutarate/Fe(II)-dependent dioxygenase YbiX